MERDEFRRRLLLLGHSDENITQLNDVIVHTSKDRDTLRAVVYQWAEEGLSFFQLMAKLYPAVPG